MVFQFFLLLFQYSFNLLMIEFNIVSDFVFRVSTASFDTVVLCCLYMTAPCATEHLMVTMNAVFRFRLELFKISS